MIERYSRPEISEIWTLENKFRIWLDIEIAACEAQAELGIIPKEDAVLLREQGVSAVYTPADHDLSRIIIQMADIVAATSPAGA